MSRTKQPHDGFEQCGAKTRAGTPCQQPAGWGTEHPGTGKCKLHGGKSTGAPKKNSNAKKHGLYAKYFPEDTLELFNVLEEESPIEILWNNIKIQYSAIILAQKRMRTTLGNNTLHESKDGMVLTKKTQTGTSEQASIQEKTSREIKQHYESEAVEYQRYIEAQSRAMSTVNNMIKTYQELCQQSKVTEEQRNRIDKLRSDIDNRMELNLEEEKALDNAYKVLSSKINELQDDE